MELKATTAQEIVRNEKDCDYMDELFGGVKMPHTQVYLKSDVDEILAAKDKEIESLKATVKDTREWLLESQKMHKRCADNAVKQIRRYRRALYKACENWAWAEHVRYVDISDGSQGYKQAQERWDKMASKCHAMANKFGER